MKSIKSTVSAPVLILITALAVVIAYQAGATRPNTANRAAVVATVNLPKVLEGLAQRSHAEASLETMHAEFRQERDRREKTVEQLRADFESLAERQREGEEVLRNLQDIADRLDLQIVNFHAWRQFMFERFDVEHSLIMQDLYRNIKKTIRELSEAEGYDLVIFDTSSGELTVSMEAGIPRSEQIERQILSRGVLYAAPALDITNHVIERMNNQFRAGQLTR